MIGATGGNVGDAVIDINTAPNPDVVTVTVPKGTSTKLFGRLKVTQP